MNNIYNSFNKLCFHRDGLYLKPLIITTHHHLVSELHPYFYKVRTWLRIIPIHFLLTIPTSFPLVQLGKSFDPRAVEMTWQDVPAI